MAILIVTSTFKEANTRHNTAAQHTGEDHQSLNFALLLLRKPPGKLNIVKENELVTRLRQDDVNAFDSLYREYHQALYFNILKLVKDTEITRDLLQEVFTKLWEKRRGLDASNSIAGWLFVVSYHASLRYLKKHARANLSGAAPQGPSSMPAETEADQHDTKWKILEEAIAHLSPQKRRVFELCKLQGKSYEQTAEELAISKHTVKEYLTGATHYVRLYVREHPEYHSLSIFVSWIMFVIHD